MAFQNANKASRILELHWRETFGKFRNSSCKNSLLKKHAFIITIIIIIVTFTSDKKEEKIDLLKMNL